MEQEKGIVVIFDVTAIMEPKDPIASSRSSCLETNGYPIVSMDRGPGRVVQSR